MRVQRTHHPLGGGIQILVFALAVATRMLGQEATPKQDCRPAPQSYKKEVPPEGVKEVHYDSAGLPLLAWFAVPQGGTTDRYPAIVYLHGGLSFALSDFEHARPFLEKGYALMTPMLRAENGNPGCFEMFAGEVDDAIAAIRWIKNQPMIDTDHVYVIGHSIGGALSALVCLRPDAGVRSGGAISGLYNESFFTNPRWKPIVPFDIDNASEKQKRLFITQAEKLSVPFIFYLESGTFTPRSVAYVDSLAKKVHQPLSAVLIEGDHDSMIPPAIEAFITRIRSHESSVRSR
jgi:acetyl esterase/lipase